MKLKSNIHINTISPSQTKASSKFKSTKKDSNSSVKSLSIKQISQTSSTYRINVISHSRYDTSNQNRLFSPIEAEKRRNKFTSSTSNSAVRKFKRPTRHLVLKPAPIVPTAPKDIVQRHKNWLVSQIKNHCKELDFYMIFATIALCIIGLLAIFSVTLSYSTHRFIIVQAFSFALGFALAVAISLFDYRQVAKSYRLIIVLNVLVLIFTFIFGQSVTETSNANWIDLGFIKIQPSEFVKLLFIYTFAVHLSHVRDRVNKISTFLTLSFHAILIFGLLLLQKDLGTLTIFLFIFVAMCFTAGLSIWYFLTGGVAVVAAAPFIWSKLEFYQQQRIMMLFDSSIDPNGTSIRYHQLKSMTAIQNGGINGMGFTDGAISQSSLLPAKHTDMIFSAICEETGLVGAFVVLFVTAFIISRIVKSAFNCTNPIGTYICVGVASMFIIQVIENVGMCLGIMPVIGITYPFLSYGGSSALSSFVAIGLVMSVCVHKEKTFFA